MEVRAAADLGCGTGQMTRSLLAKWPRATIWGVDDSWEMLERARGGEPVPRLVFVEADLRQWRAPDPLDCIISNAALHWVPDHGELLADLAGQLAQGGVLAVQIPNNREEPAFRLLASLAKDSLHYTVETSEWYLARLSELGLEAEVLGDNLLPPAPGCGRASSSGSRARRSGRSFRRSTPRPLPSFYLVSAKGLPISTLRGSSESSFHSGGCSSRRAGRLSPSP